MVVSAAIISVLMLGMASAMVIAGKAVTRTSSDVTPGAAAQTLGLIASELRTALTVTELSATAITFTVPDRTGDGNPETIRYAWSGKAGDPLTRQYNGGPAATILDSVQSLSLAYDKIAVVVTQSTESPEQTLWSYASATSPGTATITSGNWVGQVFTPPGIPANATAWKVTRAQYQARKSGSASGSTDVQLRTVTAGVPTSWIVDHVNVNESSLSHSYSWTTTTFTAGGNLTPGSAMAIAFQWLSDTASADLQYDSPASPPTGAAFVTSADSGSTWSAGTSNALDLVVYGTYTAPQNTTLYYLGTVNLTLKAGTGGTAASPTMNTAAGLLNQPQVAGP
jgi:hypothetical protein